MIFSHALTSRPIVGEMTAAIGELSAAPAFSKTSIGDEIITETLAVPAFPINGFVDEIIAEPSAVPAFSINGVVDAEPSAAPLFRLSNRKDYLKQRIPSATVR